MNFFPFHLGDYAAHTAHLELLEDLAYRRMLDLYYLREGPLPADEQEVARLIRMRPHVDAVRAVLSEFFRLDEAGWRHARCDAEIARMSHKRDQAKASAAASVNARRAKADERPDPDEHAAQRSFNERSTDAQRSLNDRSTDAELPIPIPTPEPIPDEPEKEDVPRDCARREQVAAVFDHWREVMGHLKARLDDKRRKLVEARLKNGYTVDDLKDAITGCSKSPYHMGQNEQRTRYDGLDLILRDGSKVDKFIAIGRSPLVPHLPKPKSGYVHDLSRMDYTKGVTDDGRF